MSTFEEDEIEVTEGVESEEKMDFVEEMGLKEEKKADDRLTVGRRAYGYALVVSS